MVSTYRSAHPDWSTLKPHQIINNRFGTGSTEEMQSGFEVVVSGGTKPAGEDAVKWAKKCQELGAGTILPTSMDGDGTLNGYDIEYTRAISDAVSTPVIASGGAGKLEHFYSAVTDGKADILLAASVFHFRTFTVKQVKDYLSSKGIQVIPSNVKHQ